MDMHASVGGPYGIQGFPTIKMFGLNKNSPQDYMGKCQNIDLCESGFACIYDFHTAFLSSCRSRLRVCHNL